MPEGLTQQTSESPATSGVKYIPQGAQSEGADPAAQAGASPTATPAQRSPGSTGEPQSEAVDAGRLQTQVRQMQTQLERARTQLSASDRALREREQQWGTEREELSRTVENMQMSDMSETEKVAYERDVYRKRAEEAQSQVQDAQYRAEYSDAMQQWRAYYGQMGVPSNVLDSSSIENMQHSALRWTNSQLKAARQAPQQEAVAQPEQPQSNRVQPPQVTTSVPQGASPGQRRWTDIPYDEWDAIYKKAERGQISSDQMPQ
tara:strand:+ start:162 stop:944 length:783 start_codon:yes stop_codon:yes gene_type:complete